MHKKEKRKEQQTERSRVPAPEAYWEGMGAESRYTGSRKCSQVKVRYTL